MFSGVEISTLDAGVLTESPQSCLVSMITYSKSQHILQDSSCSEEDNEADFT